METANRREAKREIGGFLELDRYSLPLLHEGALSFNCARNALSWLVRARKIKKMLVPRFLCTSVFQALRRENVEMLFYEIGPDLRPRELSLPEGAWLYLVNYYGQLENGLLQEYKNAWGRVIVDQAHAYFQPPLPGVDTLYTCRKFFGVPDGAFLYTDAVSPEPPEREESFDRMRFLLGRLERSASEFYGEYTANESFFEEAPVKKMSLLTENLLRGIDYQKVQKQRRENFSTIHRSLAGRNGLVLREPEGPFAYPFLTENGPALRKKLIAEKIYIPVLWPNVLEETPKNSLEHRLAENILPLPVDQRYGREEMERILALLEGPETP